MEEEKKKKEEEGRKKASFDKKEEQDEEPSLLPRVVKEKSVGEENKEASLAKREASLLPRRREKKPFCKQLVGGQPAIPLTKVGSPRRRSPLIP